MPTKTVTANTSAQTVCSTPEHKKCKIKAIYVDNQSTSDITITLQDVFTPDASAGVPSPSEQTKSRWIVTVFAGQSLNASFNDMECLGTVKVVASATSTSCNINVSYSFV